MRKAENNCRVEGRVYEHDLQLKTVQNKESANYGKEFIGGTLDIATDDECLNIVKVNFTYVVPTFPAKNGKPERPNETYSVLKRIIESGKTVLVDGKDAATMVRVSTSLALNDFYTNRDGQEVLVSSQRCDGGFVSIINKLGDPKTRSTFSCDMLINGTEFVEKDEERRIAEDFLKVKGAVFNFRNDLLPVTFIVKNPDGIKYFEGLDASVENMSFTKVWGIIRSENIVESSKVESAFGEAAVREYTRSVKEWIITGTSSPDKMYEVVGDGEDSSQGISTTEIRDAVAKRNVDLAEIKKRADEYRASREAAAAVPAANASAAAAGSFNF